MNKKFTAKIIVDKRIVDLLSKSTYQKSFSSAIRELVSNAYDADALSVLINIDNNYQSITVEDDGNGMSEKEFQKYLTIAGASTLSETTRRYKRKRIGQFGVGFLAIFPFCEKLEIITSVENSDEVLTAVIPTLDYSLSSKGQLINEIPIPCKIIEDKSQRLNHYTKITFINPNYNVLQYFTKIETRKTAGVISYDPYERFIWELQEDLPISYSQTSTSFSKLEYDEPIGISVYVNKKPLYRNELQEIILEEDSIEISGIECKYIFTTNYKSIRPLEARGIKMRVNNVGIGARTDFELRRDRGFSRLHWISGEVNFSEKIKKHLSLSRDSFVINPIVEEINEFFAERLRKSAYYVENIAVAEKAINQALNDSKKGNVTPKEEIIKSNLKKLTERGFNIIHKKENDSSLISNETISFDKAKKTIVIFETDEFRRDYIHVNGTNYEVIYNTDFSKTDAPCRFVEPEIIELNQNYPLFKSKTYGNLYKKLHIFLAIAERKHQSSSEMYQFIINNFSKEFEQIK